MAAAVLLSMAAGCSLYSESALFEVARAAVQKDSNLPANATIGDIDGAEFFIGKNAACVYVPYDFVDSQGTKRSDTYTVWLRRVCIRWEVDRCFPTPSYPAAAPTNPS